MADHLTAQIDDLDRELIRELEINALQTNVILAKKLKVNRNTVKTRFEKLLGERVIRILPIEDPFARGFRTQVHMGLIRCLVRSMLLPTPWPDMKIFIMWRYLPVSMI